MDGHLVAVEIGVEGGTDQRVNLERFAFHEHGLERLNAKAVKGWSAVQKNRVILNNFFQDVPHHRILLLDEFFRLLNGSAVAALLEAVIDEGLEEFRAPSSWEDDALVE